MKQFWIGVGIVTVLLMVYFLPASVADVRRHMERRAIFALNLLLGWTVIGWCVAFVWALTSHVETLSSAGPGFWRGVAQRLAGPGPRV